MKKPFSTAAAIIFAVVALAHLLRSVLGWEVVVAGIIIPLWCSWIAAAVSGGLAVLIWREA